MKFYRFKSESVNCSSCILYLKESWLYPALISDYRLRLNCKYKICCGRSSDIYLRSYKPTEEELSKIMSNLLQGEIDL